MSFSRASCAVLGAFVTTVLAAPSASAGMVAVSSKVVWDYYVAASSLVEGSESFNSIPDAVLSGPLSGTIQSVTWTASAAGGVRVDSGVLSAGASQTLAFSFAPGVHAVGGNFFGRNADFATVPVLFAATLSDGTSYSGLASGSSFAGFVSTSASQTISSLSVTVVNLAGASAVLPCVDDLFIGITADAVPAPGSVALLAAAGMLGARRRR